MSLGKRLIGTVVIVGGLVAAAAAFLIWNEKSKVSVEISTYDDAAEIFLAEAKWVGGRQPQWFAVKPGVVKLAKRPYYFKLVAPDAQRTGLIAVNDATPIVLK